MKCDILQGDALNQLQTLESESVDCCITSPPYWALRDYKVNGQLGLESTFQEYINKLVTIFDEIKRVLKRTGTCWLVIGDTYAGTGHKDGADQDPKRNEPRQGQLTALNNKVNGISQKSLCLIPERFAISMVDHGWILRNKIIWYKPNCMPSSAKDRFTVDWEYVYFFTKSQKYFFETQYEPLQDTGSGWQKTGGKYYPNIYKEKSLNNRNFSNPNYEWNHHTLGRIKRAVWKISTKPFSGAHFAVFPLDLVRPMIKAGCPEYICNKCQEPRKLEYEETRINTRPGNTKYDFYGSHNAYERRYRPETIRNNFSMSDCGCNAGFHSSSVLDPFMGSGTVGLVAAQNARDFIGIELNPEYIELAKQRLDPYMQQERLLTYVKD